MLRALINPSALLDPNNWASVVFCYRRQGSQSAPGERWRRTSEDRAKREGPLGGILMADELSIKTESSSGLGTVKSAQCTSGTASGTLLQ